MRALNCSYDDLQWHIPWVAALIIHAGYIQTRTPFED